MGQNDPAPRISKRAFLLGTAAGGGAGVAAGRWGVPYRPEPPPEPAHQKSYAQCGEDLIAWYMFRELNVPQPTYLDIGANHPTELSNTYLFYTHGCRGLLVEPNVDLVPLLREVRPEDTTLNVGIGPVTTEADYYRVTTPSWNTFDKATAEHYDRVTKGQVKVVGVVKVPLVNVNEVLARHHGGRTPDFVSLDVEGLELDILRSLDWEKHRPKVVCVETLVAGTRRQKLEAANFLVEKGYVARGSTFVNTLFLDGRLVT
jgi:FkbM family methyltransferase